MRSLSVLVASAAAMLAAAAAEPARPADSFVDSIGVNTHLPYEGGIYDTGYQGIIKPRLQELGIRHLRDGGYQYPWYWDRLKDLANSGIRSTLIFHTVPPSEVVNTAKALGGAIEAIEGPNEIDIFPFDYAGIAGADMAGVGITYMRDIYQAVKGDPAISSLPVLGVSLAWTKNAELFPPKGNIETWCDLGNLHDYPNWGTGPENGMYGWFYPYTRVIYPTKPFRVTEMGWSTWPANKDSQFVISERAHGRYLPRLALTQFNNNVERSYTYELIDQGTTDFDQEHFGLLRHDGSLKPAAEAIKNLITLLSDRGPAFTPASLDYSLSSALSTQDDHNEETVEIHHTLLQKRDGRFYLVLWQEGGNNSFNGEDQTDIEVVNVAARLQLGASVRSLKVYRPLTDGTTAVASYTNVSAIDLAVPDHPLVIEVDSSVAPPVITPQPLPWPTLSIGKSSIAGSASFANGQWTLTSSAADIWNGSDAFQCVHQPLTGDGEIVARVISQTNSDPWAKAGVMLRDGLGAGAKYSMVALTPENGMAFQRRRSTGGSSSYTAGSRVGAPYWVKVSRQGSTFRGYESADGVTWRLVGSTTISMPATVEACLVVTSHDAGELSTAVFDKVAITPAGSG